MESDQTGLINSEKPVRKRPELLSVLCILTFIGSGLAFFTYTVVSFSYEEFMSAMQEIDLNLPGIAELKTANRGFFIIGMILYGASLFGATRMWKMKKSGFHFYTMAQVLLLIQPYVYLKIQGFPVVQFLLSAIFIGLYAMNLNKMD
jgi:hypothetical protein